MQELSVKVPGINCGHCTATIQRELAELPGVDKVQAEVASKQVTVSYQAPADQAGILALLQEIGFPAA